MFFDITSTVTYGLIPGTPSIHPDRLAEVRTVLQAGLGEKGGFHISDGTDYYSLRSKFLIDPVTFTWDFSRGGLQEHQQLYPPCFTYLNITVLLIDRGCYLQIKVCIKAALLPCICLLHLKLAMESKVHKNKLA